MAHIFTYNKQEKLKSRKQLKQLFAEGKSILLFPIKVFYMPVSDLQGSVVKTGVGASSRTFKNAVDRNRIKRLLREGYRTEKLPLHDFLQKENKQLIVFMLYVDKLLPQGNVIQQRMPAVFTRLIKELQ